MAELALIISIIALYLAFMAYHKVGGLGDQKKHSETITQIGDTLIKATNTLRDKTADLLEKIEKELRTTERKEGGQEGTKGDNKG